VPVLLLVVLAVSVLLGLVRGGSLSAMGRIRVRRPWLFGVAVAALIAGWVAQEMFAAAWVVATVAMALFTAANSRIPGLGLILVGIALNAAVIIVNGGHMPVSSWATDRAGVSMQEVLSAKQYVAADSSSVLRPVGDVIPLTIPQDGAVLSPGDILVVSGLGLFGGVAPVRARRTLTARRRARLAGTYRPNRTQL
jgi:Family of unknown function (DUF5317)